MLWPSATPLLTAMVIYITILYEVYFMYATSTSGARLHDTARPTRLSVPLDKQMNGKAYNNSTFVVDAEVLQILSSCF